MRGPLGQRPPVEWAGPPAQAREAGRFHGVGFTSDESTPKSAKYNGLRFQVTYVHSLIYKPVEEWDRAAVAGVFPFRRWALRCDLSHVVVKTGDETLRIIEKQISRLGLTRYDLKSGTGDGGGENEGASRFHATLERGGDAYVRRRCFAHLPWRVADQGIAAIPHRESTVAIHSYLRNGITWTRLQALAVQPRAAGGCGLFVAGGRGMRDFFRQSPSALIEDRPECMDVFLAWLVPRTPKLRVLVERDPEQRKLSLPAAADWLLCRTVATGFAAWSSTS